MLSKKKRYSTLIIITFVLFACRFSGQQSEISLEKTETNEEITRTVSPEPQFPVVLTNTPQSFPSDLKPWLVGFWQEVNNGKTYLFTDDFQLRQSGDPDNLLGYYRFISETEILIPWGGELVQVEIWQLDQNSMLINFPDGMGVKFVRISP